MKLSLHLQRLVDRALPEAKQRQMAADYARGLRDGLIRSGRASRFYSTTVDGRPGAREEVVRLDGGLIRYDFHGLARAVEFALDYLRERSPVLTGEYRGAWLVLVEGSPTPWTRPLSELPAGAAVTVTNDRPFHRLMEVGSNGRASARRVRRVTYRNRGGHERTRLHTATTDCVGELRRRFPDVDAWRQFVRLRDGKNDVPYITKDGQEITYPAVMLRMA